MLPIETDFEKRIQQKVKILHFFAPLSHFRYTCWLRMLKTFNKEKICCPGAICENTPNLFSRRKAQSATEMKKFQKLPNFHGLKLLLSILH